MDLRTKGQIREHYEIERAIAAKLRESTSVERQTLYTWAYDELFSKVTHHPMLVPQSEMAARSYVEKELLNLERLIGQNAVFAEIGPGDCALSIEIAKKVSKIYAIDVSKEITKDINAPVNFELIISDGSSIPLPDSSVDVVYSNQLMEHLHPDDTITQLGHIYRVLKPGGCYFCVTPNRLSGPHDISRDFDPVATGLHLHEYTVSELDKMFRNAGFSSTRVLFRIASFVAFVPVFPFRIIETMIDALPHPLRKLLTFNKVVRYLLGVKLVATK